MSRNRRTQGFSVVELMVVMLVIGILATITFAGYRTWLQRQQMAEASSQVAQDMLRLRSAAARSSRDATLTFNAAKPGEYKVSYWNGDAPVEQMMALPHGTTMQISDVAPGTTGTIVYQAPYGELNVANRTITITPVNGDTAMAKNVYLVGVTGQVHQ